MLENTNSIGVLAMAAGGVAGLAMLAGIAVSLWKARSLVHKEFFSYFLSPIAYAVLVVFLGVQGWLVAGTLELRVPLTSPISVGKFGMRAFVDRGTVYDRGQRFADQDLKQGYGGGLFFALPTFSMNLDLAYSSEKNFRLHFTGGFSF